MTAGVGPSLHIVGGRQGNANLTLLWAEESGGGMTADQVKVTYPVDALVSYHYYREDKVMTPLVETGRLRLIGDSGAFSAMTQNAPIKLDEYAEWVRRWQPHLFWAASLDVIGDADGTWRNWQLLRDKHHVATVPTIHAGTDVRWLGRYAAEGVDFLGLGGMAGTGQAPRAFRWAIAAFRHARDRHPQLRFHLWGVTNRQFLDALPTWSADSSGILGAAYRYAQLRLFDPGTGKHHNVALRGDRAVYRLAGLLRRTYGVDPGEITTSHPGNRTTLIRLAAASTQQYAAWLQRRHKVTCPASLTGRDLPGPRVHMVAGANQPPDLLPVLQGPRLDVAAATPGRTQDDLTVSTSSSAGIPDQRERARSGTPPGGHLPEPPAPHHQGPRLHLVDGAPANILATAKEIR